MGREPVYAHRNSAACTNTPGTRTVHMATGTNNHFKHNRRKEVLASCVDSLHPVKSDDNKRAAKHEPTMLVCLMSRRSPRLLFF